MDADTRHGFDDHGERVPSCGFDWQAIDADASPDATRSELDAAQRQLFLEALRLQHHRGFCDGEKAAEAAIIDRLLSGRPTPGAILTRVCAIARAHGRITSRAAQRLTGKTDRALRKAFAKVPPVASYE